MDMYYLKQKDDKLGRTWKVRQAISLMAAINAISSARISGSVGSKHLRTTFDGGQRLENIEADVVQVNSDYTERQPYEAGY